MQRSWRARAERFGAVLAIEAPAALVSVDRALARRLGVEGDALWELPDRGLDVDPLSGPTEVHLAVTDRCRAGCTHCYADATPTGHHPSTDALLARLDAIAALGAFYVAFGGGEALLRNDLPALAAHARALGLVPTMTTSGLGLDGERARTLRDFAQINVSYDGAGARYAEVRGYDGARHAEAAMRALADAGVPFGANVVLTRASFEAIDATAARLDALGARELQLLRFKPSGRARLDYLAARLSAAQIAAFPATLARLARERAAGVRIDCSLVPFLVTDETIAAADLVRFGVMGCEAGRSLLALDAHGQSMPCSFWREPGADAARAWGEDATLTRFRAYRASVPEPCASCRLRSSCRGGCRIVAAHLGGEPFAPDPECPRVAATAASDASSPRLDVFVT
ncbi:MAG: radical SAM protein [Sandaracinaceae bacterium]|nr:radical SAM protein [Sandaracinaceae bacterium]